MGRFAETLFPQNQEGEYVQMAEVALKCGGCATDVLESQLENGEICPLCGQAARIKHYQTVASMPLPQVQKYQAIFQAQIAANPNDNTLNSSLAFCFLKLKLPEKALPFFEKAMADNFSDPSLYYYAAVCLLKGKKAFLAMRPEIDTIERYLDTAISLEPRGIFYYFQAYIKYDYYSRKFFKTSPTWQEALLNAKNSGLAANDITDFYQITGIEKPECL
jgi:tetratricopeptide (TPR) repeat protein